MVSLGRVVSKEEQSKYRNICINRRKRGRQEAGRAISEAHQRLKNPVLNGQARRFEQVQVRVLPVPEVRTTSGAEANPRGQH